MLSIWCVRFETFMMGDARVTPLLADHDRMETCLLYVIEKDGKHCCTDMIRDGSRKRRGHG
nr:hypothetical protein [Paenibacillus ihbetae]